MKRPTIRGADIKPRETKIRIRVTGREDASELIEKLAAICARVEAACDRLERLGVTASDLLDRGPLFDVEIQH